MAEAAPSIRKSWKDGLSTQMAMHGRDKTLSPRRSAEFFLRNSVVVVAGLRMAEAAPSIRQLWKGVLSTQMAMHDRDETLSPALVSRVLSPARSENCKSWRGGGGGGAAILR